MCDLRVTIINTAYWPTTSTKQLERVIFDDHVLCRCISYGRDKPASLRLALLPLSKSEVISRGYGIGA